jgi:two-component system, NtrC family, response regulator AtoC
MSPMRILVVDDEPSLRHTISVILREEGHEVTSATDGADALAKLAAAPADLVLCDVRMPAMDGMTFLERYAAVGGTALVVMMSAYGDADTAIAAMQRGAYDWIQKPFHAEEVVLVVRKAMERERLRADVQRLESELSSLRQSADAIVGSSPAMRAALDMARKVAPHSATVLVSGESGTGKELVARLIHRESPRAGGPFVAVNCGAIPEALLESELFGHVKGAFTGATRDKAGLFEEAHNGTLFLDEIGELPAALQVKLLRALQEGDIRRVGSTEATVVDVRVIAATNRDLEADVTSGRFRADLFYRINVVAIALPPLRERPEDLPELAQFFLARHAARMGLTAHGISSAAMQAIAEHAWPGNVRELEHAIERALVMTGGGVIEPSDLPALARSTDGRPGATDGTLSVKRQTTELEKALIRRALERTRGNRTRAARLLELSHRALLYKIREYGLE